MVNINFEETVPFNIFAECTFVIEIILNFFRPHYKNEDDQIELKTVAFRYLTGWFIPDCLSLIDFAFLLNGQQWTAVLKLLRYTYITRYLESITIALTKVVTYVCFR